MNVFSALQYAAESLKRAGIPDPRRDAELLVSFAIERPIIFLIAHPEAELQQQQLELIETLVNRRAAREPLQYITGRQEFYRLEFEVNREVLIPRPETEILVEAAIDAINDIKEQRFCEIGIGSGCISIAMLHELPGSYAVAGDVSAAALDVARANAQRHGVNHRLGLFLSDVFDGLPDQLFDAVVSNPPYVPVADLASLQAEVRDFEPRSALTDGADGLSIVKRIIEGSAKRLNSGGHLFIEIGFDQADRVLDHFDHRNWESVRFLPDLQGIPRIVAARLVS